MAGFADYIRSVLVQVAGVAVSRRPTFNFVDFPSGFISDSTANNRVDFDGATLTPRAPLAESGFMPAGTRGELAIVVDTGNRLAYHDGTAWRYADDSTTV